MAPRAGGGWTEILLHAFHDNGTDGYHPPASVIFDTGGNLYSITSSGGDVSCTAPNGCGTVLELTPAAEGRWTETVLHNFNDNGTDGFYPLGGLIFDASGNLYGTTNEGGDYGYGTVFEITP